MLIIFFPSLARSIYATKFAPKIGNQTRTADKMGRKRRELVEEGKAIIKLVRQLANQPEWKMIRCVHKNNENHF